MFEEAYLSSPNQNYSANFSARISARMSARISAATPIPDRPSSILNAYETDEIDRQNAFYNGIASRFAFHSVSGQLEFEPKAMKSVLGKSGPVGQQLLDRMNNLEANGWTFAKLSVNDPGLIEAYPNPIARTWKWLKTEGYNHDFNKRITVGNPIFSISRLVGSSYGTGSALKENAAILAHELSHSDGILVGDGVSNDIDRPVFAKRYLATEARAVLTQLHVAEQIGHTDCDLDQLRNAVKRNDLGGYIHDVWNYKEFKTINREQAVSFVNDYIEDTFGDKIVDTKTGKVSGFDINAGLKEQIGVTSQDHWLKASWQMRRTGVGEEPGLALNMPAESPHAITIGRGLKSLAAFGILGTISDLQGAFKSSPEAGAGRLTRVGTDWAGFESGNMVGGLAGRSAARFLPIPAARIILPVLSVSGGALGATLLDTLIGAKLEHGIRSRRAALAKLEAESSLDRLREQL
jgi:hypothetical protein